MKIIKKQVGELIPYALNTKHHSEEQVLKIASSIRNFGFRTPLLINEENIIIQGHGRLEAAKKLNLTEVPCIVAKGLSQDEQDALRIADNKVAEAEWIDDFLKSEFERLEGVIDITKTGFTLDEIDSLLADNSMFEQADDFEVSQKVIPKMERQLNEHNDYIVFVFTNSLDFIAACEKFDVKRVNGSLSDKTKKIGIGRVLPASKLLEVIDEKNRNNQ